MAKMYVEIVWIAAWTHCGKTYAMLKLQPFLVSTLVVIAIDSRKSKTINLYSDYTIRGTQLLMTIIS